jgi:hypothetical protein
MAAPPLDPTLESLLALSTIVYPMPIPKGKKGVAYSKAFAAPGTPAATTAAMEKVEQLRNQFLDEILAHTPNHAAISAAADRYVPELHRIIASIDGSVKSFGYSSKTLHIPQKDVLMMSQPDPDADDPCVRRQDEPVRLTQRMQFSWTSALNGQVGGTGNPGRRASSC